MIASLDELADTRKRQSSTEIVSTVISTSAKNMVENIHHVLVSAAIVELVVDRISDNEQLYICK